MNKLIRYSSSIYAFLILLGYSYLDTYYSYWGIDIYSYLDASEIILAFLQNINQIIFAIVLLFIFNVIPSFIVSQVNLKSFKNYIDSKEKLKKTSKFLNLFLLILIVCYNSYQLIKLIVNGNIVTLFAFIYIAFCIIFIWIYLKLPSFIEKNNIKIERHYQELLLSIIIIFSFNYIGATYKYRTIKEKIQVTNFNFIYDSKIYKSNDTLVLIGTTSKYLFLKNIKNSESLIFERTNISNLKFSTKHKI